MLKGVHLDPWFRFFTSPVIRVEFFRSFGNSLTIGYASFGEKKILESFYMTQVYSQKLIFLSCACIFFEEGKLVFAIIWKQKREKIPMQNQTDSVSQIFESSPIWVYFPRLGNRDNWKNLLRTLIWWHQ